VGKFSNQIHKETTMTPQQPSKPLFYTGVVLTILPAALLLFSSSMKIMMAKDAVEGFVKFGFSESVVRPLGIVEALCAVLFLIPRTSFIGAILITGYMGGAICTHLRVGEPPAVQLIFGIVAWIGYGLRRPNVIRSAF
jgi:DoxX-like family